MQSKQRILLHLWNLQKKNKQKIQDAIDHHKTWVTLLENIQTGDLNMCQVARLTEQHHNFPQALRHNFNKLDADFLLEYLRSHESGMTKLVRALIGLPQDQLFYLDEKAEQSFQYQVVHDVHIITYGDTCMAQCPTGESYRVSPAYSGYPDTDLLVVEIDNEILTYVLDPIR